MSTPTTTPNDRSIEDFIEAIEPEAKRLDARILMDLFARVTEAEPRMWGDAIIGFGEYRTTYDSGRKVHWMRAGFSPRKARHSLYLMGGYCDPQASKERDAALARLGKHKTGKSCLYVNRLADIDLRVLEELVASDWAAMKRIYSE